VRKDGWIGIPWDNEVPLEVDIACAGGAFGEAFNPTYTLHSFPRWIK
jgi:hypothetical protein